jgi:hypothetical protein
MTDLEDVNYWLVVLQMVDHDGTDKEEWGQRGCDSNDWSTVAELNIEYSVNKQPPCDVRRGTSWEMETGDIEMMKCSLYEVYDVSRLRCIQWYIYAVPGENWWPCYGWIDSDDLTLCSLSTEDLRTRTWHIRYVEGMHDESLQVERVSCDSQLTIPDIVGTSSHPAGRNYNTSSAKLSKTRCIPDLPYTCIFSISLSSWSLIFLSYSQLDHNYSVRCWFFTHHFSIL